MIIEYIWIDGLGVTRSKTRVIHIMDIIQLTDIPSWNYDGSSTYQATTEHSEVIIKPVALYHSPFEHIDYLVLCDTWIKDEPHPTNKRVQYVDKKGTRFGFEQEFFLTYKTGRILTAESPQGDYYCGVGANHARGA